MEKQKSTDMDKKQNAVVGNPQIRRVTIYENEATTQWFCGKDVCRNLGFKDHKKALAYHVTAENKQTGKLDTHGGQQDAIFINEAGILQLVAATCKTNTSTLGRISPADVEGIRRVYDRKGQVWYSACDACHKLGHRNMSEALNRHVSPQNRQLCVFDGNRRTCHAINATGFIELRTPRIQRRMEAIKSSLIQASENDKRDDGEERHLDLEDWGWIPANAQNIKVQHKTINGRVAIHYTHGSNTLLKGAGLKYISTPELRAKTVAEDKNQVFDAEGRISNYPMAWQEEFDKNPLPVRVPPKHQLTLDLLMSDFIQSRRAYLKTNRDGRNLIEPKDWMDSPQFTFNLMEWFGAFHYTDKYSQRKACTMDREVCKAWLNKVMDSLCFLLRTGIISPVDEVAGTSSYTYTLQFNKSWIEQIRSDTLPSPVRIPPCIGRSLHGGNLSTPYKYAANRLLCTGVLNPAVSCMKRYQEGVLSMPLMQYCYLTGIPPFEDWAEHTNTGRPEYPSTKREKYATHMIKNTVEVYHLFEFINISWGTVGQKTATRKRAQSAIIWIRPLYQF